MSSDDQQQRRDKHPLPGYGLPIARQFRGAQHDWPGVTWRGSVKGEIAADRNDDHEREGEEPPGRRGEQSIPRSQSRLVHGDEEPSATTGSACDPARPQRLEFSGAEAEVLRQHRLGVLAERRRRAADGPAGVGEFDRNANLTQRPRGLVLDRRDHLARQQLWIGQDLLQIANRAARHADRGQLFDPILPRPRLELRGEDRPQLLIPRDAIRVGRKARIAAQ